MAHFTTGFSTRGHKNKITCNNENKIQCKCLNGKLKTYFFHLSLSQNGVAPNCNS